VETQNKVVETAKAAEEKSIALKVSENNAKEF